jgi:glucose-1-phosphate cytidylyltransferase
MSTIEAPPVVSLADTTALILAGGRGERLLPFTASVPKPLVPLRGRPLLEHLLRYLAGAGLRRFVLCTGYRSDAVSAFAETLRSELPDLTCSDAGPDASMTDRLAAARALSGKRALVCYGDTLANVDLGALHAAHLASGRLATLTVYPLRSAFGIVEADATDRVLAFREKPELPYWINIGFLLCERAALDAIRPESDMPALLAGLAADGRLGAYRHTGTHLTVNTPRERAAAEAELVNFYTLPEQEPP